MNDLTQKLIAALIIVPVLLGIFRTSKEMWASVVAIGLALIFANLDKFTSFKAGTGGIEAQLQTAVNRAYAAIGQLKDLGLALSAPTVDELAISGRMLQYIPLKYKLERVEKIKETLKSLGASQEEIDEACSTIYQRVSSDHVRKIFYSLRQANPGKEQLFQGIEEGKMDNFDMSKLDNFIKDNGLQKNGETDECIQDLNYFLKFKKLRREDSWQS